MQPDTLSPYLFHEGTLTCGGDYFGCHPAEKGWVFRVWAPSATRVSLVGDFNGWNQDTDVARRITDGGIYEVYTETPKLFDAYKYAITGPDGTVHLKADPYAVHQETRPGTASKVYALGEFPWTDGLWIKARSARDPFKAPMNIYEVHLGSWRRYADGNCFDYETAGRELADYAVKMGYTHIELMPLSEYPYDKSWGYQVTGYFAPTSRYGLPEGLMKFVDICHSKGIGVIMDWVPAHFPKDEFGLARFDGSCAYEYKDPRLGEHPDWGTLVFDFGKKEVRSFLLSSACNWLQHYHIDGLRVDAVASMLYLDYGRKDGEWLPNKQGGKENLEAVSLLRALNSTVGTRFPGVITIAEESTAWPGVTNPPEDGGLGFHFKWNMGWMNDTIHFMQTDPLFRSKNQNMITFSLTYFLSENYILPLSHDEVVHGKHSLIDKMPGVYEDKFANLRAYLAMMIAHPGKKLLFMGSEFAQFIEWNEEQELDWLLLSYDAHRVFWNYVRTLNHLYLNHPALYRWDQKPEGFAWISGDDSRNNVVTFLRKSEDETLLFICHFGSENLERYRLGIPACKQARRLLSTDEKRFGGQGGATESKMPRKIPMHGQAQSILTDLPPFSAKIFKLI